MCGRYALYGPVSRLREQFDADLEGFDFTPRYNAAPSQWLPVLRQRPDGQRVIHLLRWGLVPAWSRDETIGARLVNARGETLADKPAFRNAYRSRRCIVPINGFYEWKPVAGGKQPYYVHAAGDTLLALAGLWERWRRPGDDETIDSFTIVTTAANATLASLHERMPVVIAPGDYGAWLDAATPPARLAPLLVPAADQTLALHEVSRAVGNVRNDTPALIERVPADS